jgi:hypothetical protein
MLDFRWVRLIAARGAGTLSRPLTAAPGIAAVARLRSRAGASIGRRAGRVRGPDSRRSDVRAAFIDTIIARRAKRHKDEQFIHEQIWQKT